MDGPCLSRRGNTILDQRMKEEEMNLLLCAAKRLLGCGPLLIPRRPIVWFAYTTHAPPTPTLPTPYSALHRFAIKKTGLYEIKNLISSAHFGEGEGEGGVLKKLIRRNQLSKNKKDDVDRVCLQDVHSYDTFRKNKRVMLGSVCSTKVTHLGYQLTTNFLGSVLRMT